MSAWLCDDAHLNVLVRALLDRGVLKHDPTTEARNWIATQAVRRLRAENVASLRARYGHNDDYMAELDGLPDLEYEDPGFSPNPLEVGKAAACYDYQACEHEGYSRSEARALIGQLEDGSDTWAYADDKAGPWGWTQADVERRREQVKA